MLTRRTSKFTRDLLKSIPNDRKILAKQFVSSKKPCDSDDKKPAKPVDTKKPVQSKEATAKCADQKDKVATSSTKKDTEKAQKAVQSPKTYNTPRPPKDPPECYEPKAHGHDAFEAPDYMPYAIFRPFTARDENLGPGASKCTEYKNAEYYSFHRFSFHEMHKNTMEIRKKRQEVPPIRCVYEEEPVAPVPEHDPSSSSSDSSSSSSSSSSSEEDSDSEPEDSKEDTVPAEKEAEKTPKCKAETKVEASKVDSGAAVKKAEKTPKCKAETKVDSGAAVKEVKKTTKCEAESKVEEKKSVDKASCTDSKKKAPVCKKADQTAKKEKPTCPKNNTEKPK